MKATEKSEELHSSYFVCRVNEYHLKIIKIWMYDTNKIR